MKCEEFQERFANLFDDQADPGEKQQLLEHLGSCGECSIAYLDYLSIAGSLAPAMGRTSRQARMEAILASAAVEPGMRHISPASRGPWSGRLRIAASFAVFITVAAVVVLLATFRNPAIAGNILAQSIRAIRSLKTVSMVFTVRTAPGENFESIDPASGYTDVRVWKTFGPNPKWRFEKPGRTIIMDGESQFMLNKPGGYVLKGTPKAGFTGWMKLFLEPDRILESELSYAKDHPASCKIREVGNDLELSVMASASGKFSNPWVLNSSIPEANTLRVYHFDKQTHLLTALAVTIKSGAEEVCVLRLASIVADQLLPDSLFVFTNKGMRPLLTLDDWDKATASGFKNISAAEAAKKFFRACEQNDWNTAERFSPLFTIPGGIPMKTLRKRFGGIRILSLGNSFCSGMYAGIFVPYLVQSASGDTLSGNLALRNDNSFHTWSVDGGY